MDLGFWLLQSLADSGCDNIEIVSLKIHPSGLMASAQYLPV